MGGARQPLCGENRLCPAVIISPETARGTEADRLDPLRLFMTVHFVAPGEPFTWGLHL